MMPAYSAYPLWWKYGGRRDFWVARLDLVANSIKKLELKPLDPQFLNYEFQSGVEIGDRGAPTAAGIKPRPFPGGMRIPHFHYAGEVYLLKEEQWAAFSTDVVADFKRRLGRIEKVSFEQLMDTADSMINTLGG